MFGLVNKPNTRVKYEIVLAILVKTALLVQNERHLTTTVFHVILDGCLVLERLFAQSAPWLVY